MMEGMGPFDLKGPEFVALYLVLAVVTAIAGVVIPRWLKPAGAAGSLTDPDQAAYLAGGAQRFADALVARLLADRSVELVAKSLTIRKPDAGRTKGELAVLRLSSPAPWSAVSGALHLPAKALKARLEERGLLMRGADIAQMRLYQTLPYALLLFFGAIKLVGRGFARQAGGHADVSVGRDRDCSVRAVRHDRPAHPRRRVRARRSADTREPAEAGADEHRDRHGGGAVRHIGAGRIGLLGLPPHARGVEQRRRQQQR